MAEANPQNESDGIACRPQITVPVRSHFGFEATLWVIKRCDREYGTNSESNSERVSKRKNAFKRGRNPTVIGVTIPNFILSRHSPKTTEFQKALQTLYESDVVGEIGFRLPSGFVFSRVRSIRFQLALVLVLCQDNPVVLHHDGLVSKEE